MEESLATAQDTNAVLRSDVTALTKRAKKVEGRIARAQSLAAKGATTTCRSAAPSCSAKAAKWAQDVLELSRTCSSTGEWGESDGKFHELSLQLVGDDSLASEIVVRGYQMRDDLRSGLCAFLHKELGVEWSASTRTRPKNVARLAEKMEKEEARKAQNKSQFLKIISDFAGLRFKSEKLDQLERAFKASVSYFESIHAPMFTFGGSGQMPNELSLRLIAFVEGIGVEVQFVHPAAGIIFQDNSEKNLRGDGITNLNIEAPNFFYMEGEPLSFYRAISEAVITAAPNAELPGLLTRTFTSKGWTEAHIDAELMRFAQVYAQQDTMDAHLAAQSDL